MPKQLELTSTKDCADVLNMKLKDTMKLSQVTPKLRTFRSKMYSQENTQMQAHTALIT